MFKGKEKTITGGAEIISGDAKKTSKAEEKTVSAAAEIVSAEEKSISADAEIISAEEKIFCARAIRAICTKRNLFMLGDERNSHAPAELSQMCRTRSGIGTGNAEEVVRELDELYKL